MASSAKEEVAKKHLKFGDDRPQDDSEDNDSSEDSSSESEDETLVVGRQARGRGGGGRPRGYK